MAAKEPSRANRKRMGRFKRHLASGRATHADLVAVLARMGLKPRFDPIATRPKQPTKEGRT